MLNQVALERWSLIRPYSSAERPFWKANLLYPLGLGSETTVHSWGSSLAYTWVLDTDLF